MTALLVSPDYVSHYLPLSAVGSALRDAGREVVVATGAGLRGRVLADGFGHVELRLGAGSNARSETEAGDQATRDFLAVTYEGMVATLEHQARRRLHDLLWDPEHVTGRLGDIVDDLRPELVLSDQLAFGASLALRALGANNLGPTFAPIASTA
jgi:UDP:flavonoid glycosyltransferase YjiC (YdhE family)